MVKAVRLLPGVKKILVARHDTQIFNVEWHDVPPELISQYPPPANLPEVIPTRSSFRKYYYGPNRFYDVHIDVVASSVLSSSTQPRIPGDQSLGIIHVYAHTSDTPSSSNPGVLHLTFYPHPGHTHHFEDASRPHRTTRTTPLPVPLPFPTILGAKEWVVSEEEMIVGEQHYCGVGMKKEWLEINDSRKRRILVPPAGGMECCFE